MVTGKQNRNSRRKPSAVNGNEMGGNGISGNEEEHLWNEELIPNGIQKQMSVERCILAPFTLPHYLLSRSQQECQCWCWALTPTHFIQQGTTFPTQGSTNKCWKGEFGELGRGYFSLSVPTCSDVTKTAVVSLSMHGSGAAPALLPLTMAYGLQHPVYFSSLAQRWK